jgi:glycosyltransferase involved in cell wall biosynthesis
MNILWIGFAVPTDLAEKLSASDKYITAQTQAFQSRIIQSLEHENRNRVRIVSSPPITDWSSTRFTPLVHWQHAATAAVDVVVPVINLIVLKQLSVFLGCSLVGGCVTFGSRSRRTLIVVGDSFFPHLLAGWLVSRVNRLPAVAFITDLPDPLVVDDPWYKRLLRPLDAAVVMGLLRRMDGLVVLSPHIATDFFPESRCFVLQGVAEANEPAPAPAAPSKDFVIMYSGALMAEYGLPLLLAAFRKLAGEGWQLWITGKGDYEPRVREAAQRDGRIKFLGFVLAEELRTRTRAASMLISLRTTHTGHARYSFPSKLLAYMATDCFVVTNRFPSLPDDFARNLIVLEKETPDALAELLERVRAGGYGDKDAFARRMRKFVLAEASAGAVGTRLGSFLDNLTGWAARDRKTSAAAAAPTEPSR